MATPLLEISDIEVVYDHIILATHGVSLTVGEGSIVALLGTNGAGKTTTLKAVSGLLAAENGALARGAIRYHGRDISRARPDQLVRDGIAQVLEGRHCFRTLSVEDNLVVGAHVHHLGRRQLRAALDRVYGYFPHLVPLRNKLAGLLSGGEQQMVAIGRALISRPRLILLDEPSMGLAPQIVHAIFEIVRALHREEGTSFLIAEQNAHLSLRHADHGYLLDSGHLVTSGTAADLRASPTLAASYFGGTRQRPRPTGSSEVSP